MNSFVQALEQGGFTLTATLDPPVGSDMAAVLELAAGLEGMLDAFLVSDNRMATARMTPAALALKLKAGSATPVLTALSCRDKNRLALTSEIMSAVALGLDGLLMVSGDAVMLGDQRGSKAVHDLDSVMALKLAAGLIPPEASPCLGATVSVAAEPLEAQVMKLHKKLKSGARFIITRPVDEPAQFERLMQTLGRDGFRPIAGINLNPDEEVAAAVQRAEAVKGMGASGLHLTAHDQPERLAELVRAMGGLR